MTEPSLRPSPIEPRFGGLQAFHWTPGGFAAPAPPAWRSPATEPVAFDLAGEVAYQPDIKPADEEHHLTAFQPESFAYNDQTIEVFWGRWAGRARALPPNAGSIGAAQPSYDAVAPGEAALALRTERIERIEVQAPQTAWHSARTAVPAGGRVDLAAIPGARPKPLARSAPTIVSRRLGIGTPRWRGQLESPQMGRRGWTRLPLVIRPPARRAAPAPQPLAPASRMEMPRARLAPRSVAIRGGAGLAWLEAAGPGSGLSRMMTRSAAPLLKPWRPVKPRVRLVIERPAGELFEPPPMRGAVALAVVAAVESAAVVSIPSVTNIAFGGSRPGLRLAARLLPSPPPRPGPAKRFQALRSGEPRGAAPALMDLVAKPERRALPVRHSHGALALWRVYEAPPKPSVMDWLAEIPMSRKLVGILLPAVLATGLGATAYLKAGMAPELRAQIAGRAAVALREDFSDGFGRWTDGAKSWKADATGAVSPRALAILTPSLGLRDYVLEFQGQIEAKALGWVFRAPDGDNYYAMKLVVLKDGPLPSLGIVRYAVLSGRMMEKVELPFPVQTRSDTVYRVRLTIEGSSFVTRIQDRIIDTWTDSRLAAGGVGFFSEAGERSRLRSLAVTHQNDFAGMLCARLASWWPETRGGVQAP